MRDEDGAGPTGTWWGGRIHSREEKEHRRSPAFTAAQMVQQTKGGMEGEGEVTPGHTSDSVDKHSLIGTLPRKMLEYLFFRSRLQT